MTKSQDQSAGGEDLIPNDQTEPSTNSMAAVDELRLNAAHKEISDLQRTLTERDQTITDLRSRLGLRRGGTMSPTTGDDRSRQTKKLDDVATHAAATGKRRDLLSYLRLRRKRN